MKKWFYFVPFVLYKFFIKRKKGDVWIAYFTMLITITLFMILLPALFFKIRLLPVGLGLSNAFLGMAGLLFYTLILKFIFPRKKLDSLVFSSLEMKIANTIVACYFLIPLLFFLIVLIIVLIPAFTRS